MIEKFLAELGKLLNDNNIDSSEIVDTYRDVYSKYIKLGQSEFDIIRHFGEPQDIVDNYIKMGAIDIVDMDSDVKDEMPSYLISDKVEEKPLEEVKEVNTAPVTKAGLIANDIFFVGLGLLVAIAGVIAIATVSVLMTAASVYQMYAVWSLPVASQRVPGFFFALMVFAMTILFYFVIVWIVKAVVKFMKKYARDHKENWAKCA